MAYLTMFTKVSFVSVEIAAESRNTLQSLTVTETLATSMIIFLVRHKKLQYQRLQCNPSFVHGSHDKVVIIIFMLNRITTNHVLFIEAKKGDVVCNF